MIKIRNVSIIRKRKVILENVNLTIEEGKVVLVTGPNGSGKSMLLKTIAGIERYRGDIEICGYTIGKKIEHYPGLGISLNDTDFLDYKTGLENLESLAKIKNVTDKATIIKYMDSMKMEDNLYKNYSTGMKKKLNIIQAIYEEQNIILLDEPFNGLDKEAINIVIKLIARLKNEKKTIIIVDHINSLGLSDFSDIIDVKYEIINKKLKEKNV